MELDVVLRTVYSGGDDDGGDNEGGVGTRMPMLPARPCLDPPPLPVSSWWRLPGTALQQAPEDGQLAVKARFSIWSQIRLKLAEATTAEFSSYRNNIIKIYIRKADIISTLPQL